MSVADASGNEVVRLHEFFVEWFNSDLEDTDGVFSRVESAFHRDFSMVLPDGSTIDRETTLAQIRSAHGSADLDQPSRIEIVDVETHFVGADVALVSYEERQFAGGALQNRRASTACFVTAADAPNGVRWLRLHETLRTAQ